MPGAALVECQIPRCPGYAGPSGYCAQHTATTPGRLLVTMGAPGSGKSTYAAQHNHVVSTDRLVGRVVSRDQVRRVFRQAFDTIEFALSRGREVVLDTTANHPAIRRQAIEVARRHRAGATLLVFNPPVEACLTAQTARRDPVPDEDVRRVHASIRRQLDQLAQEGWDEICVVRE